MRIKIKGNNIETEVIAEEFTIPGVDTTEHRFGVHHSLYQYGILGELHLDVYGFSATHAETGYKMATGDTPDEAIAEARRKWLAASPEKIAECIAQANAENWERIK